ncbi:MAG: peptidoglycan-associated lipoprotein [Halobacteriovoraceae bacterium]|nr:peptidoglycan-associated lipoprotein [Halobacteriovoraceae bacterium]
MQFLKIPVLLFLISSLFIGCGTSSKKSTSKDSAQNMASSLGDFDVNADSDSGDAGGIRTVYFPFNSSTLRVNAINSLDINADVLKKFPSLRVQVEGHCDERGSVQYNLALGEKRAQSIKDYLVASGVSADRIATISYGKERPISLEHNEMSWSKNRRGNFVIIAK